jgi:hypothetical protein
MIALSTEEALNILRALSRLEGFLFSVDRSGLVAEQLEHPVKILTDKLMEQK